MEDSIDRLHGSRVFTKLHPAIGCHQSHIHPDDRHKRVFVAPTGFYKWMVIPFGLATMPSAFQRAMYWILGRYKKIAIICQDDVLIFSRSLPKNKTHIDNALLAIWAAHLWFNEWNCLFGATERSFIGFKVNAGGIHMEHQKTVALKNWPVLVSLAQLCLFLRLEGYCVTFLHRFVLHTTQLYALTSDQSSIGWLQKYHMEFDNIRMAFAFAAVLGLCALECDYILRSVASNMAIGGILAQHQCRGPEGQLLKHPSVSSLQCYLMSRRATQHMATSFSQSTTI